MNQEIADRHNEHKALPETWDIDEITNDNGTTTVTLLNKGFLRWKKVSSLTFETDDVDGIIKGHQTLHQMALEYNVS